MNSQVSTMQNSPEISPLRSLINASWQSTVGERGKLLLFCLLFIAAYSIDLLAPWAIGYTLGTFVELGVSHQAFQNALFGIAIYTCIRLTTNILHHLGRWVQSQVAYSTRMHMMSKVFDSLLELPLRWHTRTHSGESLSKLHRSVGAVESLIGTFIWQIIEGGVKIVFAGIALFALDFWVATNVLVVSSITVLAMIFANSKLIPKLRSNNRFNDKISRICVDYLGNMITVKTLGVEASASNYLRSQQQEGRLLSKSLSKSMEIKWGATGVGHVFVISSSLLIYFYQHQNISGTVQVAQVYVLLNYLERIFQAIGSFTGYYGGLMDSATAFEDAISLEQEAKKYRKSNSLPKLDYSTNLSLSNPVSWNRVQISELCFSYSESGRAEFHRGALSNISLTIEPGERIVMIGSSGSGKTTLLKVFAGLLQPEKGQLTVAPSRDLSFEQFSNSCLLIPQEPEIFGETVRYNLTMGENYSDSEINKVVSLAALDPVISRLTAGLESDLSEKGLNLSVGERQRIALARGLLRVGKKQLLLLDEPTSSIDPATERKIFDQIISSYKDAAIIATCHRLNLVPLFSRILVMSNGAIVEQGSFSELLENGGDFTRIWEDYQRSSSAENRL